MDEQRAMEVTLEGGAAQGGAHRRSPGDALLVRSLAAFHTAALVVVLVLAAHHAGVLDNVLGATGTGGGIVLYLALWRLTAWTTGRAMAGFTLRGEGDGPSYRYVPAAFAWGGVTGMLFYFAVVLLAFVNAAWPGGPLIDDAGQVIAVLFYVMIGALVAYVIGACTGAAFALVDLWVLGTARAVVALGGDRDRPTER